MTDGVPLRLRCCRTAIWSLAVVMLVVAFSYVAKEVPQLYAQTPWREDPYDTVVSFALFFLPLAGGVTGVRLLACRQFVAVEVSRLVGLMRGCRVAIAICCVVIGSDWVAVAVPSGLVLWSTTASLLISVLAVLSVATVATVVPLYRASRDLYRAAPPAIGPDLFADVLLLVGRFSPTPKRRPVMRMLEWIDRVVWRRCRRHPVIAAGLVSLAFGLALSATRLIEEGTGPLLAMLIFGWVTTSGMFAFELAVGSYLGIVRSERSSLGSHRRILDAAVVASAAVPVGVALRDALWWLVNTSDRTNVGSLAKLLLYVEVAAFVAVWGVESALQVHRQP